METLEELERRKRELELRRDNARLETRGRVFAGVRTAFLAIFQRGRRAQLADHTNGQRKLTNADSIAAPQPSSEVTCVSTLAALGFHVTKPRVEAWDVTHPITSQVSYMRSLAQLREFTAGAVSGTGKSEA